MMNTNEPPAKAEELTGDALTIAFLKANLEELRTGGIVTVAMTNPNVLSYMEHWEARAEKAEARLSEQQQVIDELVAALEVAEDHLTRNPTGVKGWNKTLNTCALAISRAKGLAK